jgi:hypothetical protein
MQGTSSFYDMFKLSETGLKIISILLFISIIVGIIIIVANFFRRDLSGKKIMFFGGELILLGFIFNTVIDFRVRFPSLSFIIILLGTIISVAGLYKKDN